VQPGAADGRCEISRHQRVERHELADALREQTQPALARMGIGKQHSEALAFP
jgi:hypothetical protein